MCKRVTENPNYQGWSAKEYLRQYYSTDELAQDDRAFLPFLLHSLASHGRFRRALEIGCGPVHYRALPLVWHADEVCLADALEENLEAIRQWIARDAQAHDWSRLIRDVLRLAGKACSPADVTEAERFLRERLILLPKCDLLADKDEIDRRGLPGRYDLVTSYYCAEFISGDRGDWERAVGNLVDLAHPGGRLFVAAARNCDHYDIFDRRYAATPVDERDWRESLRQQGIEDESIHVQVIGVPQWKDQGFDSICVIEAVKPKSYEVWP